jgi:acyl-Coa thioesterase superfamily protein/acyl-CoA thioesterase superfamily protein
VGGAFYERLAQDRYRATSHTAGPWSPKAQHMGPPAALLARELERCAPRPDAALARLVYEVLGPVPVGDFTVRATVERPGRAVELLSAELTAVTDGADAQSGGGERPVVRAYAWRIAQNDTADVVGGGPAPLDPPEAAAPMVIPRGWSRGYLDAIEWRAFGAGLAGTGRATVWGRPLVDVVEGERSTPLQRLCAVADSGSGISHRLDIREWLFINTDLTLHLHRQPEGEWFALDAETVIGPTGAGTAITTLHDLDGPLGVGTQSLLVRPR